MDSLFEQEEEIDQRLREYLRREWNAEIKHFGEVPNRKSSIMRGIYMNTYKELLKGKGEPYDPWQYERFPARRGNLFPSDTFRPWESVFWKHGGLALKFRLELDNIRCRPLAGYLNDLDQLDKYVNYDDLICSNPSFRRPLMADDYIFWGNFESGFFIHIFIQKDSEEYLMWRHHREGHHLVWKGARSPDRIIKDRLYQAQSGICKGCGYKFPKRNFEIDHIIPRADGGLDIDDNLQLLCGACNRTKGKRPMTYLKAKLRKEGIIPRDEAEPQQQFIPRDED